MTQTNTGRVVTKSRNVCTESTMKIGLKKTAAARKLSHKTVVGEPLLLCSTNKHAHPSTFLVVLVYKIFIFSDGERLFMWYERACKVNWNE